METKLNYKIGVIFTLMAFSILSCKQQYFVIPVVDKSCNQFCCTNQFESENYEKYIFELKPIDIYKNNIQKTLLLSENSSFLSLGTLFYSKTNQNILESYSSNYFVDNWYTLEFYVSKQDTLKDKHVLHKDDEIYIRSIVGKNGPCKKTKKAKLIHTFRGKIGKILLKDSTFHIALINHLTITNRKRDTKKYKLKNELKDEFKLALILEKINSTAFDTIKVHAIIDINYKNDKQKPEIYDIKDIYGESIALIRDNNCSSK